MYESFIKEWLLNNQSRAYSVIVSTYRQKLEDLKPTLFRKWLAKEIDVPEEKVNLSSLNSALVRQRKKESKGKNKGSAVQSINRSQVEEPFTFSSVENTSAKKRTIEL
jgi:uncharacterized protein YdaU (DUF1376 family)